MPPRHALLRALLNAQGRTPSPLSAQVSPVQYCPGNSFPWSHQALRSIAVTCGVCWLHLSAPSLCHSLETLKALSWGTIGLASFVSCLSEITVLHCLRSNFLKSVDVYTFEFFGCFMQEGESPLCYSILSKAEIHWLALGRHGPLSSA